MSFHITLVVCLWIPGYTADNAQIDIVVLKKLAEVVNVVPVIAKSDSLTLEERATFKARVSAYRLPGIRAGGEDVADCQKAMVDTDHFGQA